MNEPRNIPAWAVWLMRSLALAALAVSGFLLLVHMGEAIALSTRKLPFCSWAAWLDCASVLSSPRYSKVFGVPVSALAVALYLVAAVMLFRIRPGGGGAGRWTWFVLDAVAAAVAMAAVWFIYVQAAVLHKLCVYCLVAHALGLLLAVSIWLHAPPRRDRWRAAGAIGATAAMLLVVGQTLHQPAYTRGIVVLGGRATLNVAEHPVLGDQAARHLIVEAVDYTCPRCAAFTQLYRQAASRLGPDYAAVVLLFPVSHKCNKAYEDTEPRHEHACELARLAHAVALADRGAFDGFHHWLFEHQEGMTPAKARAEAQRLVGSPALESAVPAAAQRLERDIAAALSMGVEQLPGVFANDVRFTAIPEDVDTLTLLIRAASKPPADASPR